MQRTVALYSNDRFLGEWMSTEVATAAGLELAEVELATLWQRWERRLEIGMFLDIRQMTKGELRSWLEDWQRVDGSWPVVAWCGEEQEELAQSGLDRGMVSYRVYREDELSLMRGWAMAQLRHMALIDLPLHSVEFSGLTVNALERTLSYRSGEYPLTIGEATLLTKLALAQGAPVGRRPLARALHNQGLTAHALSAHIYRLRQVLWECVGDGANIDANPLQGYRLRLV